jgi:hypothetical protein
MPDWNRISKKNNKEKIELKTLGQWLIGVDNHQGRIFTYNQYSLVGYKLKKRGGELYP